MQKKINTVLKRTYENGGQSVEISASIGIAIRNQETRFKELYQLADRALYEVKRNGRDGFAIAGRNEIQKEEN